jgi:hypothetical protein
MIVEAYLVLERSATWQLTIFKVAARLSKQLRQRGLA